MGSFECLSFRKATIRLEWWGKDSPLIGYLRGKCLRGYDFWGLNIPFRVKFSTGRYIFLPEEEEGGEFGGFRSRHDKIYLISTPYINYGVIKGFLARKKDVPTQMKK